MVISDFFEYVNDKFCSTLDKSTLEQVSYLNVCNCFKIPLFDLNNRICLFFKDNGNLLLKEFIDKKNLDKDSINTLIIYFLYSNFYSILAKKDGYNFISNYLNYDIDSLIFNRKDLLSFIINYTDDKNIINNLNNTISYLTNKSLVSRNILYFLNNNISEVIYIDRFNAIFNDFFENTEFDFYLLEFLENNCCYLNTDNLISIVKNIYIFGNNLNYEGNIVKKSDMFFEIINRKIQEGFINVDDSRDDISFNEVLQFINKNISIDSDINVLEKHIDKEKVFKLKKFYGLKL